MSACVACGAEIVWTYTPAGERMSLDAKLEKRVVLEPVLLEWGEGGYGEQLYVKSGEPIARIIDTFTSHSATCSAGPAWASRREARR